MADFLANATPIPGNDFLAHATPISEIEKPKPKKSLQALLKEPGPTGLQEMLAQPGEHTPTAKEMAASDAIEPRALLGGAALGLGGETIGEEVGQHIEKKLGGDKPSGIRSEAARLAGTAVSGALTPMPGIGMAARAGYNVLGTVGADTARALGGGPIAQTLAGLGLPLLAGSLHARSYATEPFERGEGMPPKLGPEASVFAQEPAPEPEPETETPEEPPESPPEAPANAPQTPPEPSEPQKAASVPPAPEKQPERPAEPPVITPAEGDKLTAQEINPQGAVSYVNVGQLRKDPDLLKVDPERFQFKQDVDKKGVTKGERITKWNPGAAGVITAYHTDEGNFVVNGHHRLQGALDSAPDSEHLKVQWINGTDKPLPDSGATKGATPISMIDPATGVPVDRAVTPEEARAYGAVINMQDQRGTAYDMAKFMRDTGLSPDVLANNFGVRMSETKSAEGAAMSRLSPFLWHQVTTGELPEPMGVVLGRELPDDPLAQDEVYKQIRGQRLSSDEVADMIRLRRSSEVVGEESLFGKDFLKKSTLPQQVKILGTIRSYLGDRSRLMSRAAEGKATLESAGETVIDQAELAAKAFEAKRLNDLLPKFAYQSGTETNSALKGLAYELAENPKARKAIYERARDLMSNAIRADAERAGLSFEPEREEEAPAQAGLFGGSQGATELGAGLTPAGLQKVQALARAALEKVGGSSAADALRTIFAPETRGALAQRATAPIEEQAAELRARVGSARMQLKPLQEWFSQVAPAQRYQVYAQLQAGKLDALPAELRPVAKAALDAFDKSWDEIAKIRDGDVGYIENYLPQLYADSPERVQEVFKELRQGTGKQLVGSQGFLKQRKFQVITDAIKAGLTPRYQNPVDMMMAGLQNQWRYITGNRIFQAYKDAGLTRFFKPGELPRGYQWIDDRIANVRQYAPEYHGFIERGGYAAPEQAARIINNYTAPGLQAGPAGRFFSAVRNVSALGNALRVELSAFHGMLMANSVADIEAGGAIQEGLGKLAHGDLKGAAGALARVPKTWLTPVELYKKLMMGRELLGQIRAGNLEDPAVRDVILGGGSFDFGDSALSEHFGDALRDKMGAVGRGLDRVLGVTMRQIVTPAKLGAFLTKYQQELKLAVERNGGEDLTFVQKRAVAQGVRRYLDNVMGQISRDNLHTSNSLKDWMSLIISYPGWNIGTVRLMGGIGRGLAQFATGKAIDMQAQMALQYAAGKIIRAGIEGAVINRLVTGQWPKSVADTYTWPTGEKDTNGNWIRVSPPEYLIRDALSFMGHYKQEDPNDVLRMPRALGETALGKLNWPLVAGYEIWRNADFFGNPIYFRHVDSGYKQAGDIVKYIADQGGVPFSVRNVAEQRQQAGEGTGPLDTLKAAVQHPGELARQAAVGVAGLTPAPRSLRQTAMQNYLSAIQQNEVHQQANDPQAVARQNALRQLGGSMRQMRAGKKGIALLPIIKRGGLSAEDVKREWKLSSMPPVEAALNRVPLIEVARAWRIAEEHGDVKDIDMARRVMVSRLNPAHGGGWAKLNPQDKKALAPMIREMFAPKAQESGAGANLS